MKIKIPNKVKAMMTKLEANGYEAYIVGGAVRDSLDNKEPNDWDLFTDASGEEILELFEGKVIGGDERQKKILTIFYDDVEISSYRCNPDRTRTGGTIKDHIATCDFTINAIAVDVRGERLDLVGGVEDAYNGVLRCVGIAEDRFTEDPLRVMRALRFETQGYEPSGHLAETIKEWIPKLKSLPMERIRDEMIKILGYNSGYFYLQYYRFFEHFIPELWSCLKVDGGEHHKERLYTHCIETFRNTLTTTDDYRCWLASLFHDIGKKDTITTDENGTHFYAHEIKSGELTENILKRFKFSKDDIHFIKGLVETHMFGYDETLTDKGLRRFIARLDGAKINIWQWLAVRYGDNQGNLAKPRVKPYDFQYRLIEDYYRLKYSDYPITIKDLAVGGKDLIERGEKAGKIIGYYLSQLFDSVENAYVRNVKPELLLLFEAMKEQWKAEYEVKNEKK